MKALYTICLGLFLGLFEVTTAQTAPTTGEVVVYTYDSSVNGTASNDYIVIVNRAASAKLMTGFSVRTFSTAANVGRNYVLPTGLVLPANGFYLLGTFTPIYGLTPDLTTTSGFGDDGYIAITDGTTCIDQFRFGSGHTADLTTHGCNVLMTATAAPSTNNVGKSASRGLAPNTITYTGSASDFTQTTEGVFVRNATSDILPISLVTFSATVKQKDILFSWATASEIENDYFALEQLQGGEWKELKIIQGQGTSTTLFAYQSEASVRERGKHSFRLKQVDFSGAVHYSNEITVLIELAEAFELTPAYPNPFNPNTQFTFTVARSQNVTADLYDMTGRKVQTLFQGFAPANEVHHIRIYGSTLPSGIYIYQVNGETFTTSRSISLLK